MKRTKTKITALITTMAGGAILMAVVVAASAQPQNSTNLNDDYFTPSADKLRQLPDGISVVRPTHFPRGLGKIRHIYEGDSLARTVGRNVTFCELMAEANDCTPGHVVLPPAAPAGGFDFLVTLSPHSRRYLRAAIRQEMGYTAITETRNMEVLALQVTDPALPGLAVSPDGEDDDVTLKDGRLHFQHEPLNVIFNGLEEGLKQPILDQTGLTNIYDFSLVWNEDIQQKLRTGDFSREGVNQVLAGLGLVLKPEMTNQEMVIVKSGPSNP